MLNLTRVVCALRAGTLGLLALTAGLVAAPQAASAATPSTSISSAGPLTQVAVGNEGSCQVKHASDRQFALYPQEHAPGDCGTFIVSGGVVHGPDVGNHAWAGSAARALAATMKPFTPQSQSAVSGAGTAADPLRVVTAYAVGATGLRVTQADSYVPGQESYRTDVTIENTGAATQSGVVYRAGDCFLQDGDSGYGFVEASTAGPGCSRNADNAPAGRIVQWVPLSPGSSYLEDSPGGIWNAIAAGVPFPNTCKCATKQDNAAGVSWSFSIAPGAAQTFSQAIVFSPNGVTAGQTPPPVPPAPVAPAVPAPAPAPPLAPALPGPAPVPAAPASVAATGAAALKAASSDAVLPMPSSRRCTSRRAFAISVRRFAGITWRSATVAVNGRPVAVYVYNERRVRMSKITAKYLNVKRFRAFVDLRGLARGTYRVRVRVVSSEGIVRTNTRAYRTCSGKLKGGLPKL